MTLFTKSRRAAAAAACLLLAFAAGAQASWKVATATPGKARAAAVAAPQPVAEAPRPLMTATGAAPGQTGYIHYFLLDLPDGSTEMQIGIELGDQRIAWSSPATGVAITDFVETGTISGPRGEYRVQHLFGIRPFPDDASMTALAAALPMRILPWIDDGFEHCDIDPAPRGVACVSCLGFVLRVLFPGDTASYPGLPTDFKHLGSGDRYTTEDLLVYLSGLHKVATRQERLDRVQALVMPSSMREELLRVVSAEEVVQAPLAQPARARASRGARAPAAKAARPRRL